MPDGKDDGVIRAAGAVVWRPGPRGPQVALVHRPRYDDWSYPKGKCRRSEHVLAAAIREVSEETGLGIVLGRPLAPSEYEVGGRPKLVSYWAARCAQETVFVPNDEVDEVTWLQPDQARGRLTYPRDVTLLDELQSRPVRTAPLIVLRHASAGRKAAGARPASSDLARPLDERGSADAATLAGLLASYGQCRVLSSAAERCLATVRPYAAAAGVAIEVEPAFTVTPVSGGEPLRAGVGDNGRADGKKGPSRAQVQGRDPSHQVKGRTPSHQVKGRAPSHQVRGRAPSHQVQAPAAERAASIAASGVPTVICAHRENLPALIDAAYLALGAGLRDEAPLRKGAFLVLQSAGGVLVSCERHDLAGLGRRRVRETVGGSR